MPDTSPKLQMPYILPSQAQKHITHNEAIQALDALAQISVADRHLTDPPASPAEGDAYIVATPGGGAWAGQGDTIAVWQNAGWNFYPPHAGFLAWVSDEAAFMAYDGTDWAALAAAPSAPTLWGINATADTTNRLAVSSPATLLNNEGAGHQLKINKATETDTASLLFQEGFSGRAEMGIAGNDNFSIKVSHNGSAWRSALAVKATNGRVGLGTDDPQFDLHIAGPSAYAAFEDTNGVMGGSMSASMRFYAANQEEHGSLGFPGTSAGVMYLRNKQGNLYIQADTNDLQDDSFIGFFVDDIEVLTLEAGCVKVAPSAAPASPVEGAIYFDSTAKKLRCYDGTAWRDLH